MEHETLFSAVGILAMAGWVILFIYPWAPNWAIKLAGTAIPITLSAGYALFTLAFPPASGGFGTFRDVVTLFSNEEAVMSGWIHFLAFDLFVGGWICNGAREEKINHLLIMPCLALTFLFGPSGLLLFFVVRGIKTRRTQ